MLEKKKKKKKKKKNIAHLSFLAMSRGRLPIESASSVYVLPCEMREQSTE